MITELTRKFAAWSISKAEIAKTCPKQFEFKYLLKTPTTTVPSVNRVGTVAHMILELRTGGASHEAAKKEALEKNPLMADELDSLRVLEEPIEWFMRKWGTFCKLHGITEILREQKWGLTEDLKPTAFFAPDVFFRGVLDLGAFTKDATLIVIDHKSGFAKDIIKDEKFQRQISSYGILALHNLPKLSGVRGAIHFLQGDESKRVQWLDYTDRNVIENNWTVKLFNHLDFCSAHLIEPFTATPKLRWPCEWCSYTFSCQAYQEMVNGQR